MFIKLAAIAQLIKLVGNVPSAQYPRKLKHLLFLLRRLLRSAPKKKIVHKSCSKNEFPKKHNAIS